jgi:membrane protein
MPVHSFWQVLRQALVGVYTNGALGYSKGAAYSALLSFLPVLTTTTAILVQLNAEAVSRKVTSIFFRVAPPGVEDLVRFQVTQRGSRPTVLPVVAALLAIWAASGVTISLMEAFHETYQQPDRRNVFHKRAIAMVLVITTVLPIVGGTTLMVLGDRLENWLVHALGVLPASQTLEGGLRWLAVLLRYVLILCTVFVVTAGLYRFGPQVPRSRHIWPGAALAASLWLPLTIGFTWYVRNIANYNVLYGSIGAAIALCVWMYLLALTAMTGCEFNAALDRQKPR